MAYHGKKLLRSTHTICVRLQYLLTGSNYKVPKTNNSLEHLVLCWNKKMTLVSGGAVYLGGTIIRTNMVVFHFVTGLGCI